jgi:hypothetical protein
MQNKFLNLSVHLSEKVFSLGPTEFFLSFAFLVSSKQGEVLLSLNFPSFSQSFQSVKVRELIILYWLQF